MASPRMTPTSKPESSANEPLTVLLDQMLYRYVDWREDAVRVADTYTQWTSAPSAEKSWRFSAYMAALEQEESSATSYAAAVGELHRSLGRSAVG